MLHITKCSKWTIDDGEDGDKELMMMLFTIPALRICVHEYKGSR